MVNKKESLSVYLPKLILTVSIIVSFGALIGAIGYLVAHPQQINIPFINPATEKEVTILTNKTEYEQGEIIKITVNNGLDKSILYSDNGDRFWGIEYFEDNKWFNFAYRKDSGFQLTEKNIGDVCDILLYERALPNELLLQSNLETQWNQKICPFGTEGFDKSKIVKYIESGKYRLVFYYGFETVNNDPFPISFQISEPKKVYSNGFTIKEKTANDPRCGQKAKFINYPKECEVAALGYEFDSTIKKCNIKSSGECGVETPFNSLEECQKTCESDAASGNKLKFETIKESIYSSNAEEKKYTIKNWREWGDLWIKMGYTRIAPIVDFNNDMVIAVFQGEKNTGGYSIEINRIIEKEKVIEVSVLETFPGRACMVTQALTSPYHVVKLAKSDKEVKFNVTEMMNNCESYSQ